MTRFDASDPGERRALVAEAVFAHRERASGAAAFEAERGAGAADDGAGWVRVEYADRVLTFTCDAAERERLNDLLGEFPVFKTKQPETRKAPEGTVHVAAIADAKHAADFVDAAFRQVYGLPEDYRLWVVAV